MARKRSASAGGSGGDAYVGMLWLSLIATLTGIVFLFLDYKDFTSPVPKLQVPAAAAPQNMDQPAAVNANP